MSIDNIYCVNIQLHITNFMVIKILKCKVITINEDKCEVNVKHGKAYPHFLRSDKDMKGINGQLHQIDLCFRGRKSVMPFM